jgi:hypothetical protein
MRDEFGGDRTASARPVVNDEWLVKSPRQPLTYQACADVSCLARGKADNDVHWSRRVALCSCNLRDGWQRGDTRCKTKKFSAWKFHVINLFRI